MGLMRNKKSLASMYWSGEAKSDWELVWQLGKGWRILMSLAEGRDSLTKQLIDKMISPLQLQPAAKRPT